jgi:DNA-binding SARP family transcriptional activator/TolB-like protein
MSHVDVRPEAARLRLFGRFGLIAPGGVEAAITSRRGRGLIAYLFLSPDNEESRERLCGLFWADRGEPQARASLRQCLLELRDSLADVGLELLDAGRSRIGLRAAGVGSDLDDLLAAISDDDPRIGAGRLAQMDQRQLLEDLDLPGPFAAWLEQTRPRMERSIAGEVHAQLERFERAGRWEDVRTLAEAFSRRDPLDETVAAAAIRADGATGNSAAAHRRYRILQDAMNREFGASPGATAREALAATRLPQAKPAPPPPEASPELAVETVQERADSPTPPMVVIASFETSHATDEELRLAATLRDEVVAGLSRFRDLRVVADPRSIDLVSGSFSADHEAAYILGATLRAGRDGGRLTARLLRVRDLQVIWSDGLEAPGLDVVDTIDSIIARVVGAILPMIDSDLVRNASHLPSAPIYERYVLARDAAARARTYDQARAAAQELEALIQSKPSFALPYLPLAFLYNTDFWYTRAWSSSPGLKERALELGKTALALDRGHVHGYTICGWSYLRRRQWEPARIYLEQAFALNPFHPRRVMEVGYAFLFLGDTERARKLLNRHLLLNPEPDDFYYMDLGLLSFVEGDLDMSASYLELIANPDIWGLLYRAMTAKAGGFPCEAKIAAARERLRAIWPSNVPMSADNVVTWVSTHNPFQSPDTDARFLTAVRDILPEA